MARDGQELAGTRSTLEVLEEKLVRKSSTQRGLIAIEFRQENFRLGDVTFRRADVRPEYSPHGQACL